MRGNLVRIAFAGLAVIAVAGTARALTVIDFESLTELDFVDNQFVGLGIDFNGTGQVLTAGSLLNESEFPPASGSNVIDNGGTDVGGGNAIRVDAVGGTFDFIGAFVTGNSVITLTAFNSVGGVLGSVATPAANFTTAGTGVAPNYFLSLSLIGVSYATFADGGFAFSLDDVTFNTVPLPAALPLFATALGGLGLLGWRRRRKSVALS